jgi:MFS family permease
VAMLFTGWVSSRIGGKRTLVAGLVLIVAFSSLAGASDTINGIIGFRAGWRLGNALFIATSLGVTLATDSLIRKTGVYLSHGCGRVPIPDLDQLRDVPAGSPMSICA